MTRINLVRYGFVRWPEKDFSDDGNHFTCYRAGKAVRVSKLVADGEVYLSIDSTVGNGTLPYDVYSKLPHYNAANWKWNGVSVDSLTEQDIEDFLAACLAYELEYEKAEAAIVYPTLEELVVKATELCGAAIKDVITIEQLFNKYAFCAATRISPYEWKTCQEYAKRLIAEAGRFDPDTYPQKILGTAESFDFMKRQPKESYYFTYIKELFEKYCMSI